jgi:hypothetical protein
MTALGNWEILSGPLDRIVVEAKAESHSESTMNHWTAERHAHSMSEPMSPLERWILIWQRELLHRKAVVRIGATPEKLQASRIPVSRRHG